MNNVINIMTFRPRKPLVISDTELKPKVYYRGGLWRVKKSRALNQDALDANNNALLFVVYMNQFEEGGCFSGKERQDQEAAQ